MDVRQTAYDAVGLGFSVVPPREDGTKSPDGAWKGFQSRLPTLEELDGWYGTEGCGPPRRSGVGLVLGKISGDAECLEFDGKGRAYGPFKELARAAGLGDLIERLEEGYLEGTPSGGIHWLYRCPGAIEGSQPLARYESDEIDPRTKKRIPRPLIETRGEGGYLVIAPSNGRVHPSGGAYVLLSGGLKSMPVITPEERAALFEVARTFDEMPVPEPKPRPKQSAGSAGDLTPWEDYQARTAWEDLLVGWDKVYERDGQSYWRRPGKAMGVSASTGRCAHDRLFVWSTSTEFRAGLVGDKADVFSVLHCEGDFKKAVRELRGRGFGTPRPTARDGGDGPRLGEGRRRVHGEVPAEAVSIPVGRSLDARLAWYPHTELGNAERLVERSGEGIRYVGRWKKFLAWDGARWVTDYLGRAMRRAKRTTRLMLAEAATIKHEDPKKEAELVEGLTRWRGPRRRSGRSTRCWRWPRRRRRSRSSMTSSTRIGCS